MNIKNENIKNKFKKYYEYHLFSKEDLDKK